MALFMDGFDHYDTGTDDGKWDNGVPSFQNPGAYGYGLAGQGANGALQKSFSAVPGASSGNWATIYLGYHFWPFNGLGGDANFISFNDGGIAQVYFRAGNDGLIRCYRGDGTLLATGSPASLVSSLTYSWIAVKVVIHNTTGSVQVRVNGIEVINISNVDTQNTANAYATAMSLQTSSAFSNSRYDNVHLYDGADGAPFNAILAEHRVYFFLPNADGAVSDWTANGAVSDYQCVDENPPNGDIDYISSGTVAQRSSFGYPDGASLTVHAVQAGIWARKDDAGDRGIKMYTRISATNYDGAEKLVTSAYAWYLQSWINSPASASAWTLSEFNAAEFGVVVST